MKGSFAWKSIIQAKHVMELGPVWRIGNGQSVKIRGDRWLPQTTAPKIVSQPRSCHLGQRFVTLLIKKNISGKLN